MKIRITKTSINRFLVSLGLFLVFFSSACLWNEDSLRSYILCSAVIVVITALSLLSRPVSVHRIINNRFILWVIVTYTLFEIYGLFWLRAGGFNWDFVLVSGVLQICITLMLMTIDSKDDIIRIYSTSCAISILVVCIYMIMKGSVRLSNITLGSSFGLELSGNRNTVATIIGIMLIPEVYLLITEKKLKVVLLSIAVLGSLCMLLTGSKKGVIVILLIAWMAFVNDRNSIKYFVFPLVLLIGIYAIFNIGFLYNVIGFRLKDMFAALGIGTAVTRAQSTSIRRMYILLGLKSMWHHPVLGGGMNYFQYINNARYYSHNNYVELLNNFGFFGTLLYYYPFIRGCAYMRKMQLKYNCIERTTYIFLVIYLLSKFALDYAMVSYSTMCVFSMQFVLLAEYVRRIKYEQSQNNDHTSVIRAGWSRKNNSIRS